MEMTQACDETARKEEAKIFAAAITKLPPKDGIYVTVVGHPPRPDQEDFVQYLQNHLVRGCITFKLKGVWFSVNYDDIQTGFVPPKPETGLLRQTNKVRRFIRNNPNIPMFVKGFAKHKVHHGFAMAKINVMSQSEPAKIAEWLEYFAANKNPFPEELPYKTFRLMISPMDLYPKVLEYQRTLKRSS